MTPEEFRRRGHEVVDWLAGYFQQIESFPVLSRVEPGQIHGSLPANPPAEGEPFEAMLKDVEKLILPGITHWQSPNFFAYFPCNNSGASILGDLLSSGLGVQGMLWATSPACTELETHVLDWLVDLLDLPDRFKSDGAGAGAGSSRTRPRARRCARCSPRASAPPASKPTRRGWTARSPLTRPPKPTPPWKRRRGSPASAGATCDPSRWTPGRRCARTRWSGRSPRIGAPDARRASCAPPWARRRPPPSTPCPRSPRSAVATACGCTWTPRTRGAPRSVPSSAGSTPAWSTPTAIASTPISGCSRTSTVTASTWRTGRR